MVAVRGDVGMLPLQRADQVSFGESFDGKVMTKTALSGAENASRGHIPFDVSLEISEDGKEPSHRPPAQGAWERRLSLDWSSGFPRLRLPGR